MLLKKKMVFIFAFLGILSAGWVVKKTMAPPVEASPIALPSKKPASNSIAASGIIEAVGENVSIGSPSDGIIQTVFVEVWQPVKKGDPLFQIDTRELEADLKINLAKEKIAFAQYKKIHDQLTRLNSIKDVRAISQDELRSKENEESLALATLSQARAEKEKTLAMIERLLIRSPIDGVVIQKNIKAGEFHLCSNIENPPLVIGDTSAYQIRVDIDEQNASRIAQMASGIAYPKNRPGFAIPLNFVRIEPYVIPKKSLTGSSKEKVDTRVLQMIYTFEPPKGIPLYIGQQVDVFIEREPSQETIAEGP
jgi:multidrug efflux pump subunit AcrA (membrane-fusion protein)